MFEKIMMIIWTILGIVIGIPLLIIALGGVLFGIVFGEFAVWIVRVVLLIIIGKLLWNWISG
jgi:hypothetical protein